MDVAALAVALVPGGDAAREVASVSAWIPGVAGTLVACAMLVLALRFDLLLLSALAPAVTAAGWIASVLLASGG